MITVSRSAVGTGSVTGAPVVGRSFEAIRGPFCAHGRVDCLAWQPSARPVGVEAGSRCPRDRRVDHNALLGSDQSADRATGSGVFLAHLPTNEDLILITHSNAGAYIPALSTQRSVVGAIFVDALLPPPRGDLPPGTTGVPDFLRQKVDPTVS